MWHHGRLKVSCEVSNHSLVLGRQNSQSRDKGKAKKKARVLWTQAELDSAFVPTGVTLGILFNLSNPQVIIHF